MRTTHPKKIIKKKVTFEGKPVILEVVIRSDEDVNNSRNKAYKLLVP